MKLVLVDIERHFISEDGKSPDAALFREGREQDVFVVASGFIAQKRLQSC